MTNGLISSLMPEKHTSQGVKERIQKAMEKILLASEIIIM
jgi:hypothetical protein